MYEVQSNIKQLMQVQPNGQIESNEPWDSVSSGRGSLKRDETNCCSELVLG